jgi:homoserine dehydrogenase
MTTCVASSVDVALLGCGNVGAAFARLAARTPEHSTAIRIAGALVRDLARPRPGAVAGRMTTDPRALLDDAPSVVVELLGGVEPARTILLEALARRIPVVTANKTLLSRCGRELREASAASRTPLLYEAAVVAGVPFLGTFARRPYTATVSSLVGIVNGTSNFVLGRCGSGGTSLARAVAEAQRLGYAEPDPRNDLAGIDASEKLAVLLQHFAARFVNPDALETNGIESVEGIQLEHAAELGGGIKPVVHAGWTNALEAFAAPAFVPAAHPLARVDGVDNAILMTTAHGRLLLQGPGAGPEATAATVLDDVREIAAGWAGVHDATVSPCTVAAPETEWLITLRGTRLAAARDVADLLASFGVFTHRATAIGASDGHQSRSWLAWPCARPRVELALSALRNASGCEALALRALEVPA